MSVRWRAPVQPHCSIAAAVVITATMALGGLYLAMRHPDRVSQGAMTLGPLLLGVVVVLMNVVTERDLPAWLPLIPVVGLPTWCAMRLPAPLTP